MGEPEVGVHGENLECGCGKTDRFRKASMTMETTVVAYT